MRRLAALFSAILFLIGICLPVSAESRATDLDIQAAVYSDGSAHVSLRLNLRLDSPGEKLVFPIPANARDVLINGVNGSGTRRNDLLELDLTKILGAATGDFTLNISYTLPRVVRDKDGVLMLELPLLCGFDYPIDGCSFTVTLPGDFPGRPTLTSTYYQTRIEESLDLALQGTQAMGTLNTGIMGSDWLTLSLRVSQEMFPQEQPIVWSLELMDLLMIGAGVLALLYWLIFLRTLPPRPIRRASPPDGITAGDLGPALTMMPSDLTMLVVQWAQLGYILIQMDDSGRVLLHKRMNMDNERSQHEIRIFRALFGTRRMIDGTGYHYALLCRKVAAGKPGIHGLFRPGSGNPGIFRALMALIGGFGGWTLGAAVGMDSPLQSFWMVVLGLFGLISAWIIQSGGKVLHLRKKQPLWMALGLCGVWILLGLWSGDWAVALGVPAAQLAAGIAAAYGGRRTELGKTAREQILGFRRYLTTVSKEELQQILKSNPDYYHTLAPYALALGVDRQFASRFGGIRVRACPYLTAGMDGHLTALEWSKRLGDAVNALDARQRQLALERLLSR